MPIPIRSSTALFLALALFAVTTLLVLKHDAKGPGTPLPLTDTAPPQEDFAVAPGGGAESPQLASVAESNDDSFVVDRERLYDVSYLVDPLLIAHATANNVTAECLLARAKKRRDGVEIARGVCRRLDAVHFLNPKTGDYASLSNDELASLALADASAAVVMGRRLNNRVLSERWFELAVALSGKAGPLQEWVANHDDDLGRRERLELQYEVYLTTAALGFDTGAAEVARERLTSEGVDLAPIYERANARLERLSGLRQTYVGKPWGES